MAKNLSSAAKRQNQGRTKLTDNAKSAAKKVADKLAKPPKSGSPEKTSKPSTPATTTNDGNKLTSVTVPGLTIITPEEISGMLPTFKHDDYKISDPLKPPSSLPQVTQADFDSGMAVYEGAQRALKLTGAAFDTTRERFVTIGRQVKAFGAGIQTATEFEKAKGNYIDYLNQVETNDQKSIALDVSQHKTTTERNKAVHTKDELTEKQKQASIAAEKARQDTQQKQSELDTFKSQLGTLTKAA